MEELVVKLSKSRLKKIIKEELEALFEWPEQEEEELPLEEKHDCEKVHPGETHKKWLKDK